jgi:hypothetical protein
VAKRRGILVPSLVADRRADDRPEEEAALLANALEEDDERDLVGSPK